MFKDEWKATSYLIGVTIGAGIIALPYVFAHTGFLVGTVALIICWVITLLLTLALGEIVLRTKEDHEVSGLIEKYLGKKAKHFMACITVLYIYGAILAYGMGLGEAIHGIFGFNILISSVVLFFVLSAIVYFGLKSVSNAEVILTPFIFFIIGIIFLFSYNHIAIQNYYSLIGENVFMPLGPLFFALMGFWCVPDMKRILKNKKSLKKAIILGVTIPAVSYLIFAVIVVGVTGESTTEVFSVGLAEYVGPWVGKLLYLFTFFTISTSFIGLGFSLKEMFCEDYSCHKNIAWLAAFGIPLVLLFVVKKGFVDVIGITGALSTVFIFGMTMVMFYKAKKLGKRKPEFTLNLPKSVAVLIIIFCLIVAIYTAWKYIFI
ncbi:MAG: aromatic amino acid transport family protein [Candidatus Woesearchaeota archaeon]|jgi:amino acid permease